MEPSHVQLHNWPHNPGEPGGWVIPEGEPINRWHVTKVHARYIAPAVPFGATDASGRHLRPRREYHAYLVDLAGDGWGIEDYERVLLHQAPPIGQWMIKMADENHLAKIERYRVKD